MALSIGHSDVDYRIKQFKYILVSFPLNNRKCQFRFITPVQLHSTL